VQSRPPHLESASVETVEYYPFLVKGYQNTYPKRRIVVTTVIDARDFKDAGGSGHEPYEGHPAIGVVLDQTGSVAQRLYGPRLGSLVQDAISRAAQEAGMVSSTTPMPLEQALAARNANYVIFVKITRCWISKHSGADQSAGPSWFASAEVVLDVAIYKPPFDIPFWQGQSTSSYSDPPLPTAGTNPEDETEIYDQPGQVLSVALTRAVAGIFKRDNLHTLIIQDSMPAH
jgi:hypothetical protein